MVLQSVEMLARMGKEDLEKFSEALTERFQNLASQLIFNFQSNLQAEEDRKWEEAK